MKLMINGNHVEVSENPPRDLLWVLRDELGLTGTKFSCGAGICGDCTVDVNGEALRSCITSLSDIDDGASIRTIEGLITTNDYGTAKMHPVQSAFLEEQSPTCTCCLNGQIMTAVTLLEKNPTPTQTEIIKSVGQNVCQQSCHQRIKNAVVRAASQMTKEKAVF